MGTRHLIDADTGEDLGPATDAQTDASDAAPDYDNGTIWIDLDGDVVLRGSWGAQQPGSRRVYVEG